MLTFIVDLHGNLPGLGLASALLYPLQAPRPGVDNTQVVHLATAGDLALGPALEALAQDAGIHLQRTYTDTQEWQVIFLLDLPSGGRPLDGCLTDTLHRLSQHFLKPLAGDNQRPWLSIALLIDTLKRDEVWQVPFDGRARLRWKLDVYGMAGRDVSDDDLDPAQATELGQALAHCQQLFTETDLHQVAETWHKPVLPKGSGVRQDQHLATLPDDVQEHLMANKARLEACLQAMITKKKAALPAHAPGTLPARLTDPAYLDDVHHAMLEALGPLQEGTLQEWRAFSPRMTLQRVLRRCLSLDAVKDEFSLLRFALQRTPNLRFQRGLIELAYLLVALVEAPPSKTREHLDRGRSFAVVGENGGCGVRLQESAADDGMARVVTAYHRRLAHTLKQVSHALRDQAPLSLEVLQFSDSSCRVLLDDEGWQQTLQRLDALGPVDLKDGSLWTSWVDAIHNELGRQHADADAQLTGCIDEVHQRLASPIAETIDVSSIDAEVRQRRDTFEGMRTNLLGVRLSSFENDWHTRIRALSDRIQDLLVCRPTPYRLLLAWVAGLLLLVGPLYVSLPPTSTWDHHVLWSAALAGLALLPLLGALHTIRTQIRKWARQARAMAKDVYTVLQQTIESRKAQMELSYRAQIARENYKRARRLQQTVGRRRIMLKHHESKLQNHLKTGEELQRLFPTHPAEPPSDPHLALDETRPVFENRMYWLTGWSQKREHKMSINKAEFHLQSALLDGLDEIELQEDRVYGARAGKRNAAMR